MDTVKVMKRQVVADRATQAALATRMTKADKVMQKLLQNLKIMQCNMAAATSCKDADKEFGENDVFPIQVVEAPLTHTWAYHLVQDSPEALKGRILPLLGTGMAQDDNRVIHAEKAGKNID